MNLAKDVLGEAACEAFNIPLDAELTQYENPNVTFSPFMSGAMLTHDASGKWFLTTKGGEVYCSESANGMFERVK